MNCIYMRTHLGEKKEKSSHRWTYPFEEHLSLYGSSTETWEVRSASVSQLSDDFNIQLVSLKQVKSSPDVYCLPLVEAKTFIKTEHISSTDIRPPVPHLQFSKESSSCLTPSNIVSALSNIPKNKLRRAASLPDMKLQEFTPAISADETYRYQCSVSGLVFNMKGEGDVLYRTVPWNRRLLAQHHKKPAGPLFDIKCLQQSVCQLHLPHCEIISTGGARSLQVAHVSDEDIEFIGPHQVTQTHVVLNISGFSAYGNVKDENSPPDPVRALVLLFYKPPEDPDLRSVLSVLMLQRNVVIRDVQHTRRKLVGDERYIDTSPHCKLHPQQSYTLSTSPEDDLIKVQPKEADFDGENHESYFSSFQRLLSVRRSFIDGISGPVLSSLMDHLLEKKVITDAEREEADGKQKRAEKACEVIDTVRRKGASSEMMELLTEIDPFFCKKLGLI